MQYPLKEICYQRDCERIVILANQESIPANYQKRGGVELVCYTGCSQTYDNIIQSCEARKPKNNDDGFSIETLRLKRLKNNYFDELRFIDMNNHIRTYI